MSFVYRDSSLEEKKPFIDASESPSCLDELDLAAKGHLDGRLSNGKSPLREHFRLYWYLWLIQILLFLSSCTILFFSLRFHLTSSSFTRQFSAYSPATSAVKYEAVKFNITTKGSSFVGAGPDVDKAWRAISYDMGDQMISTAELSILDMPESSLKVTHPQSGVKGYRVGMEVFHQLHCINLLRRVTYKDYYEPLGGEFAAGPEALQKHTDHCLEVLRLNTQCNADVGVFTFYMVEGDPLAWPELNSWHKCRNFDRVMDWALEHSVGNMEVLS